MPRAGVKVHDRRARSRSTVARRPLHQPRARVIWIRAGLLVAAAMLVYANSVTAPFVLDDNTSIVENARLHDWTDVRQLFSQERNTPLAGRPLVAFTFAVNYAAGGLAVQPFHLTNIAIHALCALLLFGIVRRTFALPAMVTQLQLPPPEERATGANIAFAAALLWTVHPLNSEVVDYVTQRTESLMALCLLTALYAAIRSLTQKKNPLWQIVTGTACALGMLCKESMVVAPVLIVFYERIFFFDSLRAAFAARWRLYGGLALTWVALLYMMVPGPRSSSVGLSGTAAGWNYLLNQAVMIVRYFRLALWPHGLVVDYGPTVTYHLSDVLPQVVILLCVAAATIVALRFKPAVGFLGAWIFVTLAPTSSFVPITTEVGAERRMYLPLMAIAVLFTIAAFQALRRNASTKVTAALTGVTALILGATTFARNRDYASDLSLAQSVLRHWPTDVAHGMMGSALGRLHRDDEAVRELRLAARTDARSRYNLGVELYNMKRFDEAIRELEGFAGENPMMDLVPSARRILGDAFASQQKWPQAVNEYRLVLSMIPSDREARRKLVNALNSQGLAFVDAGNFDNAVVTFRKAVEWDQSNWSARHNLAAALLDARDPAGAEREARKAIEANPLDPGSYDLLGRALAIQGKYDEALAQFREALKLSPQDAEVKEDLDRVERARRESRK